MKMSFVYYKFPNINELYIINIGARENIPIKELIKLIMYRHTGGKIVGFTLSVFSEETNKPLTTTVDRNRTVIVKRIPTTFYNKGDGHP
jgi:hypothetical protein